MRNKDLRYFAAKESKELATNVLDRANSYYNLQLTNGWLEKLESSYRAYHGAYYGGIQDGHAISFSGSQGELVNFPVNHYRNIAEHILNMTTSSRPAMHVRAVNTDYKSVVQSRLANGVLDYYMREKDLEKKIKNAVRTAIVLGSGFIKIEWDAFAGEIYDYDTKTVKRPDGTEEEVEDENSPLYEGDVKFTNLSPFDVVVDSYKEDDSQHDWIICRTFKNKYDLAAKYPEKYDQIVELATKSDNKQNYSLHTNFYQDKTDDVPVYEFYHRRTEALPKGRYMVFLSEEIILHDQAMPYRDIPLVRIAPSEVMGTPYGYSPLFDLLPLQEAANSLYSSILTNQSHFSVQNVIVPTGQDITVNQLEGGLNLIECNMAMGEPKPLNLTATPKEIFEFLEKIIKDMETLSGVNSVTRGQPLPQMSGTAMALIQSLALQFSSNLQQEYIKLIEGCGTMLLRMLQDFATTKRTVTLISGISNETEVKEFSKDDLTQISRVVVEVSNPLSKTASGKIQMADNLLQYGNIDADQYMSILTTGNLEVGTERTQNQRELIKKENENLLKGKNVIVLPTDMHIQHINEHRTIFDDPDLRFNEDLVTRTRDHIMEHYQQLSTLDPQFLMLIGQQPIQPMPPVQGATPDQVVGQDPNVMQGMVPGGAEGQQQLPPEEMLVSGTDAPINVPQPAKPPGEFKNMPVLPGE